MIHDAPRLPMAVTHALRDLERVLKDQSGQGRMHAEAAHRSLDLIIRDVDELAEHDVGQRLRALKGDVQLFRLWVEEMTQELAPHAACALALNELSERFQPIVLIVDDNEFERKLVGQILDEALYDLMYANSGADALAVLRKVRPDLILLDMDMPELNGLETLARLKNSPGLASIPVMMITGHSGKDVVVSCIKAGAVDFSVKPLDRENLLRKVAKFLTV